jgi:SNF2 family DNA or RNA helicase
MLSKDNLHPYQIKSVEHVVTNQHSMLFLDMGLGKTVATLTAIVEMFDRLQIYGVLIVGPLRVIQSVWKQEAAKWEHTRHLKFSFITGSPDERTRGLMTKADIYLINYDNLVWLQEQVEFRFERKGRKPPFNMLVADEVSKLKATRTRQGTKRGEAVIKLLKHLPYRVGLTGTPGSNGMQDLFGQFLVIDGGRRLGTSFSRFRSTYFYQTDFHGYKWSPFTEAKRQISDKIGDITLNLSAEDYLQMPDKITNDIWLDMPPKRRKEYDLIEHQMFVELDSGAQVDILNEASKINRCLQFANGAMYSVPGSPDWENLHDAKLDALEDIVEESAGKPVLVAYQFQHDAHKIKRRFPDAVWVSSKTSEKEFNQALDDWNNDKLSMIIGHPASMGHGIDRLQHNGHTLVWYGVCWSLDLYDQTNARLWRQGQNQPVIIHRLLIQDTVDEAVKLAIESKTTDEISMRKAIEDYKSKKVLT